MLLQVILLTIGAYLLGSVPTSYIAGRVLKGIDIRDYGSGTVSGSNVYHSVARWAVVPVGIFDVLKGLIPVAIACYVLHFPVWAVVIVGLAAIAGHNWPIFLRFSGGRGISTMMGVLFILAPWVLLVFIVIWLLGIALGSSAVGALAAALALPIAGWALPVAGWGVERSSELTFCLLAITLLLIIKRLLANRGAHFGGWRRVVVYRLLLDRDIPEREAWVHRSPSDREEPPQ
jgi:glycerol-3-phosphate acyltransferase PlsY